MGLYKYKYFAALYVLIVTIACYITRSNGSKFKYNISSWKFCLKSDHILSTLTQVTLSQCVDECATRTDCQAVNYFKSYHICELIPENNGVLFETTKVNRGCVLVKKDDMITTEINESCPCGARESCDLELDVSCTIKECETLTIQNGRVNGNMRSIGSSITYECNQMYIATFQESGATCLANGTWSYTPDCTKDTEGNNICKGCIRPRDCQDVKAVNKTAETGLFKIYPIGSNGFMVRCDMDTQPGGWTVFQRRESNSDFEKDWEAYKEGFGQLANNFWLGNDKIWKLTSRGLYKLRVDLIDQNGSEGYAEYSSFSIGNESTKYVLNIAGQSGTADDSLIVGHNGMMFSTIDRDNDTYFRSCVYLFKGGWWYSDCQVSNLNGPYGNVRCNRGMTWKQWRGNCVFMKFTEMKIRRK
ncbi:fibrinogen-like protein A [Ruditapes philippinarum]|uniref:fibrinogen-like protein A n=1 Tax=Ruditapes philippinarum TaxID=129788 RepID=UPI00295BBECE|nr:fibrinogen-like protein A [Ruditapes philippinarum]